ncbi:PREDICTED: uncharacterized protein LOC109355701 isoform X2 [Lupinus angustifolius]|uniref:uncharacterized protein LOC109352377 isoform X2 n=1 Tax=Lupinus angustifolius TaxID=3871 RepID=UPI00092EE147|nr:PREDICTED: uncharacterized protein LOC109352377 isoform X2 [Lupinus angustifolius]XP_019454431.1 PREDICTED: uncharacterized protein LOC109355701 isoform X2 [Lupinus angustifolius]
MECCKRPNRSDMHVSVEEEAIIEEETREYFDEIAPKRHTKPQRSEYSSQYVDAFSNNNDGNQSLPELLEFQRLENDPQETTGSGFINVEKSGKSFRIEPDNDTGSHHSSKGNPATNDWVPAPSIEEGFNSDKPNRSDN